MADVTKLKMFRITLKCVGVPNGAQVAAKIEADFAKRPWHVDVHCWWDGKSLFLTAWNDFDDTGLALREEFSDLLPAHVDRILHGEIETIEVLSMK